MISSSGADLLDDLVVTGYSGHPIGAPVAVKHFRGVHRKRFARLGSSVEIAAAPIQSPLSSHWSRHLVMRTGTGASSAIGLKGIAPTPSSEIGMLPSSLVQPPLSPSVSSKLGTNFFF